MQTDRGSDQPAGGGTPGESSPQRPPPLGQPQQEPSGEPRPGNQLAIISAAQSNSQLELYKDGGGQHYPPPQLHWGMPLPGPPRGPAAMPGPAGAAPPFPPLPSRPMIADIYNACSVAQPMILALQMALNRQPGMTGDVQAAYQNDLRTVSDRLNTIQMAANALDREMFDLGNAIGSLTTQRDAAQAQLSSVQQKVHSLETDLARYEQSTKNNNNTSGPEGAYSRFMGDLGKRSEEFPPALSRGVGPYGPNTDLTPTRLQRSTYNAGPLRGSVSRGRGGSTRGRYHGDQMHSSGRYSGVYDRAGHQSGQSSDFSSTGYSPGSNVPRLLTMQPHNSPASANRYQTGSVIRHGDDSDNNRGVRRSTAVEDLRQSAFGNSPSPVRLRSQIPAEDLHHSPFGNGSFSGRPQNQATTEDVRRAAFGDGHSTGGYRHQRDNHEQRNYSGNQTARGEPLQFGAAPPGLPVSPIEGTTANTVDEDGDGQRKFSSGQASSGDSSSLHPSSSASNIQPRIQTPEAFQGQLSPVLRGEIPLAAQPCTPRETHGQTPRGGNVRSDMVVQKYDVAKSLPFSSTDGHARGPAPQPPQDRGSGSQGQTLAPPRARTQIWRRGASSAPRSPSFATGPASSRNRQAYDRSGSDRNSSRTELQLRSKSQNQRAGPPANKGKNVSREGPPKQVTFDISTELAVMEEDGLALDDVAKSWRSQIDHVFTLALGWVRHNCPDPDVVRDAQISQRYPRLWLYMMELTYPETPANAAGHVNYMLSDPVARSFFITRLLVQYIVQQVFSIDHWVETSELMRVGGNPPLREVVNRRVSLARDNSPESRRERQELMSIQAKAVMDLLTLPEWPKYRQQKINGHVNRFKDIAGPLMNEPADRTQASHDLYSIALAAIELSARLMSSRLSWRWRFQDCGDRFADHCNHAVNDQRSAAELTAAQMRIMMVVTPEANYVDDGDENARLTKVAKAKALVMP